MIDASPPQELHQRLGAMPLVRLDGGREVAGELWAAGPAVLVFLRHFGCAGCVAQIDAVRPRVGEIARLGGTVAFIGCGTVEGLRAVALREGLDEAQGVRWRTDPTGSMQRAAGLAVSWSGSFGPRALMGFARALGQGYEQPGRWLVAHPDEGDRRQQGGLLVVARGGPVVLAFRSERLGDLAPLHAAIDRCLALAARGAEVRV